MATVIVIDDDPVVLDATIALLEQIGHRPVPATTLRLGLEAARAEHPEAALVDIHLPDGNGTEAINLLRDLDPNVGIILITGDLDVDTTTQGMRRGAFEYLTKPFSVRSVKLALDEVLRARSRERPGVPVPPEGNRLRVMGDHGGVASRRLLGETPEICRANLLIERYAKSPGTPILVQGESGTGKELCASAIHMLGDNSAGPFVKINCPAIPRTLIESELFGFEKGSFTDAKSSRPGVFEQASGGTLFLDEIGELDLDLQPKLLRVLEEKTVYRIGSRTPRPVDVRVVSATNRSIPEYCRQGRFREDLYFRLAVLQIDLPPLRARRGDIPLLAEHILRERAQALGRYFTSVGPEVMEFLVDYPWPGNVRELRNFIERLIILSPGQGVLHMSPDELRRHTFMPLAPATPEVPSTPPPTPAATAPRATDPPSPPPAMGPNEGGATKLEGFPTLEEAERDYIMKVLAAAGNNRTTAAQALGIARSTLCRKLVRYRLSDSSDEDGEVNPDPSLV